MIALFFNLCWYFVREIHMCHLTVMSSINIFCKGYLRCMFQLHTTCGTQDSKRYASTQPTLAIIESKLRCRLRIPSQFQILKTWLPHQNKFPLTKYFSCWVESVKLCLIKINSPISENRIVENIKLFQTLKHSYSPGLSGQHSANANQMPSKCQVSRVKVVISLQTKISFYIDNAECRVKCRPNLVTFVNFINYKLINKTP